MCVILCLLELNWFRQTFQWNPYKDKRVSVYLMGCWGFYCNTGNEFYFNGTCLVENVLKACTCVQI